jgi:nicotinamidase-related amidase
MTSTTALIVADLQAGITTRFPFARPAAAAAAQAVTAARGHGIPVIFVRAALRPSGADLGTRNQLFQQFFKLGEVFHEGRPGTEVTPELDPLPGDPVVTKRRTSAFHGSDLEILLRVQGAQRIVLCGTATGAVVAATAYAAADLDFEVTILSDACADPAPDVHAFLTTTLFPSRLFEVLTVSEWAERVLRTSHARECLCPSSLMMPERRFPACCATA